MLRSYTKKNVTVCYICKKNVTVCCKPRDRLRQKATPKAMSLFCQSEIVPNGRCDLGSLNSVVTVVSGSVAIVLNFCNLQFL